MWRILDFLLYTPITRQIKGLIPETRNSMQELADENAVQNRAMKDIRHSDLLGVKHCMICYLVLWVMVLSFTIMSITI